MELIISNKDVSSLLIDITKEELSIIYSVMCNISTEVEKENYESLLKVDVEQVLTLKIKFEEIKKECSNFMSEYNEPTLMRYEYKKELRIIRLFMYYSNFDVMKKCFGNLPEAISCNDWPCVSAYTWDVYLSNLQQVANILENVPW